MDRTAPYHGPYKAFYSIIVKAPSHDGCKFIYNKFKALANAFNFGDITISEHKSARKGDVLGRELQIFQHAYPSEIILFRQAIDTILSKTEIQYTRITAKLAKACVEPEQVTLDIF